MIGFDPVLVGACCIMESNILLVIALCLINRLPAEVGDANSHPIVLMIICLFLAMCFLRT